MKGFTRKEPMFSLCGLNCALCSMHVGGYCPGCGGGEGNQSCALARCSLEHGGLEFCADCAEYPCARYEGYNDGRRKSMFCTAAYLLPLPDLRETLQALCALPAQDAKERAASAAGLLQTAAAARGISLKLVKKPKSRTS